MSELNAKHYTMLAEKAKLDNNAFIELYKYFFPRVYNFIFARIKNSADADDITSEVFIKMNDKLNSFDSKKASFSTWLFRIAVNALIDHTRKQDIRGETEWDDVFSPESPVADTPEANAMREEDNKELLLALDKLSDREKKIVEMRYFADAEFDFIAESLNMKPTAVRVALHRALGKLKNILGEDIERK